jgi:hypothetical protein
MAWRGVQHKEDRVESVNVRSDLTGKQALPVLAAFCVVNEVGVARHVTPSVLRHLQHQQRGVRQSHRPRSNGCTDLTRTSTQDSGLSAEHRPQKWSGSSGVTA